MSSKINVRNMRSEYRYSLLWNLLVLALVVVLNEYLLPKSGPIGNRTMFVMYAFDGILTLMFMYWLEKYTVTISGLYEQTVITVLSNLYTLFIMCFINLVLFTSKDKLIVDLVAAVIKTVGVFAVDAVLMAIRSNPAICKRPRLLILGSQEKNFARMKRIKYGVLKNYDSWYESLSGKTPEEIKAFINEKVSNYDALCVLDGLSESEYTEAVNEAMEHDKDLFIVPKIIDVGKTNARLVRFDDVLTLYMPEKSLSALEHFIKRATDIVLAAVGTVIAAIPMAVIALLIKLTSPGPVFYKQERLTKDKKSFYIYKFRTMIPDAEKLSGPKFAEKDDPRITPIGKFLRACRLDELPQILNILKGDMSVVGPRPERPMFIEQFEQEIENYDYRFAVKAGLTSLSHVYGRYSTYIHDRTYYDLFYITHYSLLLDLKIILLTTKTLFLKSAAEGVDDFSTQSDGEKKQEVNSVES